MVIKLCVRCNRERLHYAHGLCFSCYNSSRYSKTPKAIERNKTWHKEHGTEYQREYWKKNPEKYAQHKRRMRIKQYLSTHPGCTEQDYIKQYEVNQNGQSNTQDGRSQ